MSFDSLLDEKVDIQRPHQLNDGDGSYTDDEDGGFIPDFGDVSVKISHLSDEERVMMGQLGNEISHIMSLRPLGLNGAAGITRQHRVVDSYGVIYEVKSAIRTMKPTHHLKVFCNEINVGEGVVYGG